MTFYLMEDILKDTHKNSKTELKIENGMKIWKRGQVQL